MASKIVAFSPTPLVSNKLSRSSGKPIGPCSVIFPSGKPSGLAVVRAQSNGDTKDNCTSLDVRVSNNQGTTMMEQRLRWRWALHASPIGKYSAEEQKWTEEGLVIESLPDGKFQVQLDNGATILGYLSGKMRQRFIRVMPGDRVKLDLNRYDLSKGRITYRLRNKDKVVNKELEE